MRPTGRILLQSGADALGAPAISTGLSEPTNWRWISLPQYSYLPYNLGLLYTRIGDFPEARRWFESAEKIAVAYPRKQNGRWTERAETLNALGTLAIERHDSASARKYFADALADDPLDPNTRENLALLADADKDYAQADRLWLALIKDSPDYIAARVHAPNR